MKTLILILIILFSFKIFPQDYKIIKRGRDNKYALLKGSDVVIPYHKGTMFFMQGQDEENFQLNSLDVYFALLIDVNDNPQSIWVAAYNETGYAAIYNLAGEKLSGYIYDFSINAPMYDVTPDDIRRVNEELSAFGFTKFYRNGKQGFLDLREGEIIPALYDYIGFRPQDMKEKYLTRNSFIWFQRDGKMGIMLIGGTEFLLLNYPIVYTLANPYLPELNEKTELLARAVNNKGYGLIKIDLFNKKTQVIFPPQYDELELLNNDEINPQFKARKNKKWAILDSKGKKITDFIFDSIERIPIPGIIFTFQVGINNWYGLVDLDGNYLVKPEFWKGDRYTFFDFIETEPYVTGIIILGKNNKYEVRNLLKGASTGFKYDAASFLNLKGGGAGEVTGRTIEIKIFASSDLENDKIGILTDDLKELWSKSEIDKYRMEKMYPPQNAEYENATEFKFETNASGKLELVPIKKIGQNINSNGSLENSPNTFIETPDQSPVLIGNLKLVYPEIAKRAGVEGKVDAIVFIDEQGNVVEVQIIKGIGAGCDQAAIDALLKSKFKPGLVNGASVKVKMKYPVKFILQ